MLFGLITCGSSRGTGRSLNESWGSIARRTHATARTRAHRAAAPTRAATAAGREVFERLRGGTARSRPDAGRGAGGFSPTKSSKPNGFMIRRSRSLHAQDHTDKNGCEQTRGDFRGSLHVTSHASPRILARLHRSMAQAMHGRAARTLPCARRPPTSTIMQRRGAHLYSGAPRNRTQTRTCVTCEGWGAHLYSGAPRNRTQHES